MKKKNYKEMIKIAGESLPRSSILQQYNVKFHIDIIMMILLLFI